MAMACSGLLILILFSAGQTDQPPAWDPALKVAGDPDPRGERKIRVIRHADRSFRLSRAFRMRVGIGPAFLTGEVETDIPGIPRGELDLPGDLGLDPVSTRLEAVLTVRPFPHLGLRLEGSRVEWEGSKTIRRDLLVGKVLFPAGTRLSSRFEVEDFQIAFEHELDRGKRGFHGYRMGARYFRTELTVRSRGGGKERNQVDGGLPMIGYQAALSPATGLEIEAGLSLFPAFVQRSGADDEDITQLAFGEIELGARFLPLDWLTAGVEYAFLEAFLRKERDGDDESVTVDTHVIGFWMELRF